MRFNVWTAKVVLGCAVPLALTACATGDDEVDAALEELKGALQTQVVPVLEQDGPGERAWDAFHDALLDVRREDLWVSRGPEAYGDGGSGSTPSSLTTVVTLVVDENRRDCVAVRVVSTGEVNVLRVGGDTTRNCAGATIPDRSFR